MAARTFNSLTNRAIKMISGGIPRNLRPVAGNVDMGKRIGTVVREARDYGLQQGIKANQHLVDGAHATAKLLQRLNDNQYRTIQKLEAKVQAQAKQIEALKLKTKKGGK